MVWLRLAPYAPPVPDYGPMFDARGFWTAWQGGLYDIRGGRTRAYVSALLARCWRRSRSPWPIFAAGWTGAAIACLFWMRVPWMLAFPGVIDDILRGNIHVFLAGMVVLSFRHSAVYAFGILTKVTPGIGLIWHAARGAWRSVIVGTAVTVGLIAASFVLSADLSIEWIGLLAENAGVSARFACSRCRLRSDCPRRLPSWHSRPEQTGRGSFPSVSWSASRTFGPVLRRYSPPFRRWLSQPDGPIATCFPTFTSRTFRDDNCRTRVHQAPPALDPECSRPLCPCGILGVRVCPVPSPPPTTSSMHMRIGART